MPSSASVSAVRGPLHDALCSALRGEDGQLSRAVLDLARFHRVHLLLAHGRLGRIEDDGVRAGWSAELREAAIADLFRERELTRMLRGLAAAGIDALLMKGAALAYSLYAAPHLRPRADLDVLIARSDLEAADRVLLAAGWLHAPEQSHDSVMTQRHYVLGGNPSCAEHLDLHWKIAVPHVFGDALGFGELGARAVPLPALGPDARILSPPDALFLACLHRVAHHHDSADLLWLWDIHLLTSTLTKEERTVFAALAAARSMRAVCSRGIELACERFATSGADALLGSLRPRAGDAPEPSARFLGGGMREVDRLRSDLAAVGGWRARLTLVSAHLFPGGDYVRSLYPRWPAVALPLAYVHRALRGAPAWFRRPAE
ncbi:MAG: nucleotidyltransferase family protein [Acidobacteriota bacterium]